MNYSFLRKYGLTLELRIISFNYKLVSRKQFDQRNLSYSIIDNQVTCHINKYTNNIILNSEMLESFSGCFSIRTGIF